MIKLNVDKVKRLFRQVLGLFPSRLPQGVSEFESWLDDIINTYSMPTQNRESLKVTVSTSVMHLGPTVAYKSKYYFVLMIKAGAAKQIAHALFTEVQMRQNEARQKAFAEATAQKAEASSGPKV